MGFSSAFRFSSVLPVAFFACVVSLSAGAADPFNTSALHSASPGARLLRAPCQAIPANSALDLVQVVEQSLCNNPQTRIAWANARAQAAQVGVARGAYLPSIDASAQRRRSGGEGSTSYGTSAGLSFSYLLYDFGGREASLEYAQQLMAALSASEDATLQSVFLSAVQAYYNALAAEAAVTAANESERASQESFKSADARYRVGSGTPADRLQAQTALAQASLARIQAEGKARTELGVLANTMGLDAHQVPKLAAPAEATPQNDFERNIAAMIDAAKQQRPDLVAAQAQVKAAEANIDAVRASGLPKIRVTGGLETWPGPTRGNSVGVSIDIPLFSGFNTTYKVRAAEAQLDAKLAQRDQVSKQVSLDVWRAYYALQTGTESVRATTALIASATQSEKVASGRYKAGVGSILEMLNAQSALASARQQHIQAQYNWRIAKASLAQAMGQLDFDQLNRQTKP
ncbi:MAG: outer membrane protein [Proteobacteria bacterium]|nr:outer membrane protein [Pseudomonadota bacterium]